ncbi:hypothetical protein [Roseovarius sp.]|uniref:hypothetical protein n=1 Tax=Roseovarius sp. TaxID=1486281 RepID=UPI003B59AA82
MTQHNRDLSSLLEGLPPNSRDLTQWKEGELPELFLISLEAHKLALISEKNVSAFDLLEEGTWQKYEQRAAALARRHPSRDPFRAYLAHEAHGSWTNTNSRQSYRSAVVRLAAQVIIELAPTYWRQVITQTQHEADREEQIRRLKPHVNKSIFLQMKQADEPLCAIGLTKLARAADFILKERPDPGHTALNRSSSTSPRTKTEPKSTHAKSEKLYCLNRHQRRQAKTQPGYNWRDHFWRCAVLPDPYLDDHRRACIATLMLTGCRSAEFSDALGVSVSAFHEKETRHLTFEISGAKCTNGNGVREGKGQQRRYIEIVCRTPEAEWLFDYLLTQKNGQALLCLYAPRIDEKGRSLPPSERKRRVSNSLGKLICRLGKVAFPTPEKEKQQNQEDNLSPYVFRHALSSDLRAAHGQLGRDEIALALGHQSERTQNHYGSPNTSKGLNGSRAEQIMSVSATSPVRTFKRSRFGRNPDVTPE